MRALQFIYLLFGITLMTSCNNRGMSSTPSPTSMIRRLQDISNFKTYPKGIDKDFDNNIYIAFSKLNTVAKFNSDGEIIGWIGFDKNKKTVATKWTKEITPGGHNKEGAFNYPHTIKIYNNFLFISEYFNNRIQKFTLDGEYIGTLGVLENLKFTSGFEKNVKTITNGNKSHLFRGVSCFNFNNNGELLVTDYLSGAIIKFNSNFTYEGWVGKKEDGKVNNHWGKNGIAVQGNDPYTFKGLHSLAFDDDYIYIADTHNHRVQRISHEGNYHGWLGMKNNHKLSSWEKNGHSKSSSEEGGLNGPIDLILKDGYIYILEAFNNRISKFSKDGGFISHSESYKKSTLNEPYHFTVFKNRFLISDTKGHRVISLDLF